MISRIKALLSSIDLRRLDTRRIDLAMAWAQRHPLATAVYNLGNYLFLGAIKAAQWSAVSLVKLGGRLKGAPEPAGADAAGPAPHPVRSIPDTPRVLILAEDSIPQCFEYRVRQKLEMLEQLGWGASWLPWSQIEQVQRQLHFFDVLLLYRVPGFDAVLSIIEYARTINKLLIYDLDDLVFDRTQLERKFAENRGQLSLKVYRELLTGADLYRKSMALIPFCIVSTESLKEQVEAACGVTAMVLANGISTTLLSAGRSETVRGDTGAVVIFYGSGTKTHDADFKMVSPVLLEVLDEHPDTRLVIAGPLRIDAAFERFASRVQTIEFLEYPSYLEVLGCADINIAPLEPGVFADCKSEIKWLEAGMLGVPSVVSGTRTFRGAVTQGETGYLAESLGDWKSALAELIEREDTRQRVGEAARAEIARRYGRSRLASNLAGIVHECIDASPAVCRSRPDAASARRVLMVNTLYPPQSMGGATRVLKDLVDALTERYGEIYEIAVFTCDVHDTRPYHLREYVHDGVVVQSVSVPMRPDLDRRYEDDTMRQIFGQVVDYYRPDVVHFHSVQRLTASTLHAVQERSVPYVVTLHDSWWISDYPFMIDDGGNLLPGNIGNPLVASRHSNDFNATAGRNRWLRHRLRGARALVGVSEYQRDLYRLNGFENVRIVENGVDAPSAVVRNGKQALVLGYAGGKSEHKGYFFLKDCISSSPLENTEIVVVDLFSKSTRITAEKWGAVPVEVHPRFGFADIGSFYSLVDVVVVPSMWPESFGLVVREASLLGLWVVASDAGGLKGAVIEGETGFTYPPGDADALRHILTELDGNWRQYKQPVNPDAVERLGINTVAQNALAIHELYQEVLRADTRM